MSSARHVSNGPWFSRFAASMLLWICRTLGSLAVAWPLLLAIRASGMASGPAGDRVLFRPGSLLLFEQLRVGLPLLSVALEMTLALFVLAAVVELVPLALSLDLLDRDERPLSERFWRALRLFPAFVGMGAIVCMAQAALLLASSLLGAALKSALLGRDERVVSLVPLAVFALGLICCLGLGSVLDLSRAALVVRPRRLREALVSGLSCLRERPAAVLLGAYSSIAASAFVALAAVRLVIQLDLSSASKLTLVVAFVAHQAAVAFGIAWRVRWLARALDLVRSEA